MDERNTFEGKPLTLDTEWKFGEVDPRERRVSTRHILDAIKRESTLGNFVPYDLGVNVSLNGRHVMHFGSTFSVPGDKTLTRKKLVGIILKSIEPILREVTVRPDFTPEEQFVLFNRDNFKDGEVA